MSYLRFDFPRNMCPPDEYVYHHPDGNISQATDQDSWFAAIRKHYKDNGVPMPENIEQVAIDQRCRTLPPGFCKYENGDNPDVYVNRRVTPEGLMAGMTVLYDIMMGGGSLVDQAKAEERARICAACPANVQVKGCYGCEQISQAIVAIKGAATTPSDPYLSNCAVCFCRNKAQVWVSAETLAKGVNEDQMKQFASIPHCWKGKEIRALQEQAA